jgi:hypothetical protein
LSCASRVLLDRIESVAADQTSGGEFGCSVRCGRCGDGCLGLGLPLRQDRLFFLEDLLLLRKGRAELSDFRSILCRVLLLLEFRGNLRAAHLIIARTLRGRIGSALVVGLLRARQFLADLTPHRCR